MIQGMYIIRQVWTQTQSIIMLKTTLYSAMVDFGKKQKRTLKKILMKALENVLVKNNFKWRIKVDEYIKM